MKSEANTPSFIQTPCPRHEKSESDNQNYTLKELQELGVNVLEPTNKRDQAFAETLGLFASFCLSEQTKETLQILDKHMGNSVGELQGGNENHSIYRVSIDQQADYTEKSQLGKDATGELIQAFCDRYPRCPFSVSKLQQYMLNMCNDSRRQDSSTYSRLGNLMFILSLGPVHGQVRHIDHMAPNLQVCLYMSEDCPATIVYSMESPSITSCQQLLEHWEYTLEESIPPIIQQLLREKAQYRLAQFPHLKYFAFWNTLDSHLAKFGQLFQHVDQVWQLKACHPGTALIVNGNQVHAGPPSARPRLFAFAIAIPDDNDNECSQPAMSTKKESEDTDIDKEDQDGEIQYNPVLLHVDLCSILFTLMEFESSTGDCAYRYTTEDMVCAKHFLLNLLIPYVKEYPHETYSRLIGDERSALREWLGNLVIAVHEGRKERIACLLENALDDQTLFQSPDIGNLNKRKKENLAGVKRRGRRIRKPK